MTKKQECWKALQALYLQVDATIVNDVQQKVVAAIKEAEDGANLLTPSQGRRSAEMSEYEVTKVVSEIWDMAQLNKQTDKTPFSVAKGGGRLKSYIDYLASPDKYLGINEGGVLIVRPSNLPVAPPLPTSANGGWEEIKHDFLNDNPHLNKRMYWDETALKTFFDWLKATHPAPVSREKMIALLEWMLKKGIKQVTTMDGRYWELLNDKRFMSSDLLALFEREGER